MHFQSPFILISATMIMECCYNAPARFHFMCSHNRHRRRGRGRRKETMFYGNCNSKCFFISILFGLISQTYLFCWKLLNIEDIHWVWKKRVTFLSKRHFTLRAYARIIKAVRTQVAVSSYKNKMK